MSDLNNLLDELESYIANHDKINNPVSEAPVGWHLDHILLVINGIVGQLQKSNPDEYKWQFNWKRTLIKTINTIPRGKGKAPKSVTPVEVTSIEQLKNNLEIARINSELLNTFHPKSYFYHPYFGDLNLKTATWFLKLHTKHHLKIINDIISKG